MELKKTIENLRKTGLGYFNLNKEVLHYEICKTGLFIWDGSDIKTYSILTKYDIERIEIIYNIKKWYWYYIKHGNGFDLFNCPYYKNYKHWDDKRNKKGFYIYSEKNRISLTHQDDLWNPHFIDTEFDDERRDYSEYWKTL